jgi:hypothetical protein
MYGLSLKKVAARNSRFAGMRKLVTSDEINEHGPA